VEPSRAEQAVIKAVRPGRSPRRSAGELPRPPSGHAPAAAPGALRAAARSARYRPGARGVSDPRITGIW